MTDVAKLDAVAQAELLKRREVSSLDLVEMAIARAEALNPTLNAIVTPMYDAARAVAKAGPPDGPFRGVPFLVKDLVAACAGVRQTECSRFLEAHVAPRDTELVTRFRRAGLVILGMTNASEFGLLPAAEPALFGATRNPWDLTRSTGGSSGGSAAAVAAGIVPMAHANDMGGSIRIPASCCGLFGLKPTRARTPVGPDFGDLVSGLVHQHVVTRSVRDSAALLDAISGPALGDPYSAPSAERPFADEAQREPGRLRIAFTTRAPAGSPVHADCIAATETAAKLCASLGHDVVEAAPDLGDPDALTSGFVVLLAAHTANVLDGWARETGQKLDREKVEPCTWALAQMGRGNSSVDYLGAVAALQRIARRTAPFFEQHDVWLTPTLAEPPLALGTLASPPDAALMGLFRAGAFAPFTIFANATGQPSATLPLHWNAEGLPIGTLFTARFGDEATLFRLAAQLERERPWRDRWPD